jgi:DNA-binding transcriptional MerR regulator
MTTMRISQLAERSGVPASTLRFYESSGLLPAERSGSGYRLYGDEAVRRLAFIDAAKHLGLPLEEIGELLGVWESGACAQVKADLRPRIANRLADAERRAAELAAFTSTLRGALRHLDALPDRAEPCDPQCSFLGSAATPPITAQSVELWRTAPVACTLAGDGMDERAAQWHAALQGASHTAIPDGLRLTMPADRAATVAALAAAEQQCCAFFDFRLHLDGPDLHLEVRAPEAGGELLTALFAQAA